MLDGSYLENETIHITEYNTPWYKRDFLSLLLSCIMYAINPLFKATLRELTLNIIHSSTMDEVHRHFLEYVEKYNEKDRSVPTINIDNVKAIDRESVRKRFEENTIIFADIPRYKLTGDFYRVFLYHKSGEHFLDIIKDFFVKNREKYGDSVVYHVIGSCINKNESLALRTIGLETEYMDPFNYIVYEMMET
jgi:hypothetical protein